MNARDLLQNYGDLRQEEINGRVITILPTCNIPFEHLLEENWRKEFTNEPAKSSYNSCGNFRFVWKVPRLSTGEKVALYVKHPERVFTTDPDNLKKGHIWWGGPRSGEKKPLYFRHPLVEEQTVWQAAYLLELYRCKITAEVPLAIVEWPNGSHELGDSELILHDTEKFPYDERFSHSNLDQRIKETGLVPVDLGGHNIICPQWKKGVKPAIIDVNRWLWPPYTDGFQKALLEAITTEVNRK